jgi:hypothetical protein
VVTVGYELNHDQRRARSPRVPPDREAGGGERTGRKLHRAIRQFRHAVLGGLNKNSEVVRRTQRHEP